MKWFKNLFAKEEHDDTRLSEIAVRTAEIQARIAAFRSSYPWSEESNTHTQTQSQPVVAKEQPKIDDAKSVEMDDLRAKLLGKKR